MKNKESVSEVCQKLMTERGLTIEAIAELVHWLQKPYQPDLCMETCVSSVVEVLSKREVQFAIITGLTLDQACEKGQLPKVLEEAIASDESLYGIDEVLGISISNIYGTIGMTTFGYVDKMKKGIIGELDRDPNHVNTFADDLAGAVAAAAAARLAHRV